MATVSSLASASASLSTEASLSCKTNHASLHSLFKRCKEALEESLSYDIMTSERIVSCLDVYNFHSREIPALYQRLGYRIFDLCDFGSRLIALRELAKAKMHELGLIANPLAWSLFAKTLKVGACDEMSMTFATSMKVASLFAYRIILLGQKKLNGSYDHHVVLAYSSKVLPFKELKSNAIALDYDFLKTFQTLENTVIVDAYHHKVIPTNVLAEDSDYKAKLESMGNTKFLRLEDLGGLHESDTLIVPRLMKLQEYLTFLQSLDVSEHPHFFDTKTARIEIIKNELAKLSKTPWKLQTKTGVFWTLGAKEPLEDLYTIFEGKGLATKFAKVKDKEEFCLQLFFSNYTQLCTLQRHLHS